MASKKKAHTPAEAAHAELKQQIVNDTFTGKGYSVIDPAISQELAASGHVEVSSTDPTMVRATQLLADEFPSNIVGNDVSSVPAMQNSQTEVQPEMATSTATPTYPTCRTKMHGTARTRNRVSKYPFALLGEPDASGYDSFHISASADVDAKKKFAGVVSTATMREKKAANGAENYKRFVIRTAAPDDPNGPGARVFRVR
jgi:hypothetical protein